MKEELIKWHSKWVSRDLEMLVFGHAGVPVIIFPTTAGMYYEARDFLLIESVKWFVEQGLVKIYCPDGMNQESWYNKKIRPVDKIRTHIAYENAILNDLVHKVKNDTPSGKVVVAGCSFGGYQAANFAFRHPDLVSHLFCMSGAYDIKSFLDGYYDEDAYFNNPVDYLPNNNTAELWQMDIVLGAGEEDICRKDNDQLSQILNKKNINHWLDIRPGVHDWPLWRDMFPHYLSRL